MRRTGPDKNDARGERGLTALAIRVLASALAVTLCLEPMLALAQQEDTQDQAPEKPKDAQPTANAEAEAKLAYAKGNDSFKLGHYPEAIQFFEDSYRLSHRVEILFNIGLANRKAFGIDNRPEYLRRALDIYKQFLRLATDDSERKAARQSIGEVTDELALVDERDRVQRLRSGGGPAQLQLALRLDAEHKPQDALAQLDGLLQKGHNSTATLQDVYRLEGEIGAEAGQNSLSTDAFKRLLVFSPSFELPHTASTGARANLEKARKFWVDRPFAISPVVPPPAEPDKPLNIPVVIDNDVLSMVSTVTVLYRRSGERAFSSVSRLGPGDVTIPAIALPVQDSEYRMEYFVQATDTHKNLIASIGGENAPLSFPVLTVEEVKTLYTKATPWYASWWFVTTASLVAVAGGLGIAYGAGAFEPAPPPDGLGRVTLGADRAVLQHR